MFSKRYTLLRFSRITIIDFHFRLQELRKQACTGRTIDGATFPCNVRLRHHGDQYQEDSGGLLDDVIDKALYDVTVLVFANISGLVTFLPDGQIHSCNQYFSSMMTGYDQSHLIGKVSQLKSSGQGYQWGQVHHPDQGHHLGQGHHLVQDHHLGQSHHLGQGHHLEQGHQRGQGHHLGQG